MRILSFLENQAMAYVDPMAATVCSLDWDIIVIAEMPQKGITMRMKMGVILGLQLAV
jgi:hypothetical protein